MVIIDIRNVTPRTNGTRKETAIKKIARHHSATPTGSWEAFWPYWNKTKGWGTGGYHEIILRNGDVQLCYDPVEITNGIANHNTSTYHICVVGNGSFTDAQEKTFDERCKLAMKRFGLSAADILGHNEFSGASTSCPGIDMSMVRTRLATGNNTVADTKAPVKKEGEELEFSSGTLRKEWETFLNSKAQREIAVQAAVKAGYSEKWIKDMEEGKATDGDIVMLGLGALIRVNK
ncbi:peptidoglycan recognition family protein [Sporosarcina sp. E16_8]|uniref:peptidoglycan recognition protein family protein n=1 Tax=Sporosarcina sp. E16_8 TaxID=2789295 RepID=UPI001A923F59|nr:peptidoglycan recognition family protein [Sporosarcina sp. E16_8]